jgi:hypothetical protein
VSPGWSTAEELFGAVPGQIFHHVDKFAAAVITLSWITFGVLVSEDAAGGLEHGFRSKVFASDEFQPAMLALHLVLNGIVDVGIDDREGARHSFGISH